MITESKMAVPRVLLCLTSIVMSGWMDVTAFDTVPADDCITNPMDIYILLDASKSVTPPNFIKMLEFVRKFADAFDIGPDDTQIGITSFATNQFDHFWMNSYTDKPALLNAIQNIVYADEWGTVTGKALDHIREEAFNEKHGGRDGVMKILILITDGRSNNVTQTQQAADRLHKENIIVLAVGVDTGFDPDELQEVATDPSRFLFAETFDALPEIQGSLQKKVCEICPFWVGTDAVFIDGKCVRLFLVTLTWDEAKAACKAVDPKVSLVELKSDAVRIYVENKTQEMYTYAWLGATDAAVEGTWRWSAKNDIAYIDPSWWNAGQPDNYAGKEHCLMMRPDRKLNDMRCGSRLTYFCESVEVNVVTPPP